MSDQTEAWPIGDQAGYDIKLCTCEDGAYVGARQMGKPDCCERCGFMTPDQWDHIAGALRAATLREVANYCTTANWTGPAATLIHLKARDLAEGFLASDWLAARVAEAVDRERAAWATKIEALADSWTCAPTLAADLRSLLPVDATPKPSGEGGAPDDVPTIAGSEPATPSPEPRCSCGSGATSLNRAEVVVHRQDGPCYIADRLLPTQEQS